MFKAKVEYALKHYAWLQSLYKVSMSSAFRFLGCFIKTDPNLVLYNSMVGRSGYDSPKAIFDYLKDNPEYSGLRHVWAFNDPSSVEGYENCEIIKMDSPKYFITALKARYWITNVNIERGLHFKKRATRYINTWHGLSFNHIGNDVPGRKDYNSKDVTFICYESDYHKKILMQALCAPENIMLPSGLPRNDELYHVSDEEKKSLRCRYGIPEGKKVIMYAPTWRDSTDGGKSYAMAPPIDFKKWEKELGNEYVVLLRTHHFTTKIMNVEFNDFVYSGINYPRINDLFKIADILISDYSSCMADFSILERPMICFAYDFDEYSKGRGLYIDFEKDLPIDMARTEDEVISKIKTMDWSKECEKAKKVKERFTPIGGHATEICVNALFKNQLPLSNIR